MTFRSGRHFQLWDFNVSHKQLLLRSPAVQAEMFNIDIIFINVKRLDIPTSMMGGLEVGLDGPSTDHGTQPFRVTADGKDYSVVASSCMVYKNQLNIMESSLGYVYRDESTLDRGEVLYWSTGRGRLPEVAGRAST